MPASAALARQLEHLVGHVEADRLAGRGDPAGGDEHVRAGPGAQVEHRLALVQIGDGGRDAAAERGLDRRARRTGLLLVEGRAEHLVAVLVGRGNVGAAARDGGFRPQQPDALPVADSSRCGGIAVAHALADVGLDQLSHADSSLRDSGRRSSRPRGRGARSRRCPLAQHLEVVRDGGLGEVEQRHQLADADLAGVLAQHVDELEANGIG